MRAILREAMSENLDLVRSIFAAWERGDFSATDWADPEIEFEFLGGPDPVRSIGVGRMADRSGPRRLDGLPNQRGGLPRALRRPRACADSQQRPRMEITALTGAEANLFEMREGKVVRLVLYWDRDRALADLGLEG